MNRLSNGSRIKKTGCSEEVGTLVVPQDFFGPFWDERPTPDTPRASWWIGEANGGSHWSPWGKPFQNLSGYHFHCLRVPGSHRKQVTADAKRMGTASDQRISLGVSHTCLVGGFK